MQERRKAEKETFKKQRAIILKDFNLVEAETHKMLAKIVSEASAEIKSIKAKGELKAMEVKSKIRILKY